MHAEALSGAHSELEAIRADLSAAATAAAEHSGESAAATQREVELGDRVDALEANLSA